MLFHNWHISWFSINPVGIVLVLVAVTVLLSMGFCTLIEPDFSATI
jgi:hypothetical protein